MKIAVLIYLIFHILKCDCYNVLVMFTTPMRSHDVLGEAIVNLLLNAGHEVTYVTPFPKKTVSPKMHQIDVSTNEIDLGFDINVYLDDTPKKPTSLVDLMFYTHNINIKAIENKNLKQILNDSTKHFDAVILDAMCSDLLVGIPALYECPLIWISSIHPHWQILRQIDELPNPAEVPDCCQQDRIPPLNLRDRIQELYYQMWSIYFRDIEFYNAENAQYVKLFGPLFARKGRELPSFNTLRYNASLVLSNSHPSMGHPIKLPPNFISVGGFHIETKEQSLSKDLQELMDNAKHGVIFFSLGSNLRSKDIPENFKRDIISMFGKLKQVVIWKIEETPTDLPQNVRIINWAPQQGILAHPNCILFISHGGLLSVTEAFHYGIPMVGIPVFADQFKNINLVLKRGFAKRVDLTPNLPKDLELAINAVLHDKRYIAKAKEWSAIFHHRSVHPGQELVHWVEHVIITGGASYLRSPALEEPFYRKMYLDLLGIIILVLTATVVMIKKLIKLLVVKNKTVKTE